MFNEPNQQLSGQCTGWELAKIILGDCMLDCYSTTDKILTKQNLSGQCTGWKLAKIILGDH